MFSAGELDRAARAGDPGLTEALRNAQTYGVAEYLATGPKLLQEWEDARDSPGPHARGAALISAAIDIRRAGYTSAIPRAVLDAVHAYYLEDAEQARQPREPLANAWVWATRTAQATAALLDARTDDGPVEVFDYLVDTIQRREGSSSHVPESVVRAAIDCRRARRCGFTGRNRVHPRAICHCRIWLASRMAGSSQQPRTGTRASPHLA